MNRNALQHVQMLAQSEVCGPLVFTRGKRAAGDAKAEPALTTQPPAAAQADAELQQPTSEPVSVDSDGHTALTKDTAAQPSAAHATAPLHLCNPDSPEPQARSQSAESTEQPEAEATIPLSQSRLQQVLSDWPQSIHPPDVVRAVIEEPASIGHSIDQPPASQPEGAAQPEVAPADTFHSRHADSSLDSSWQGDSQSESAEAQAVEPVRSDDRADAEQAVTPAWLPAASPPLEGVLCSAVAAIAAWLLSSLLLQLISFIMSHAAAAKEAAADCEEAEGMQQDQGTPAEDLFEQVAWEDSPEAMHTSPEAGEGTTGMGAEQGDGVGVVTRARSVARSVSEAVTGLMTNRSGMPEAEEVGQEAESAPGGSGACSTRGRKPRGRRELSALGKCPLPCSCSQHGVQCHSIVATTHFVQFVLKSCISHSPAGLSVLMESGWTFSSILQPGVHATELAFNA